MLREAPSAGESELLAQAVNAAQNCRSLRKETARADRIDQGPDRRKQPWFSEGMWP